MHHCDAFSSRRARLCCFLVCYGTLAAGQSRFGFHHHLTYRFRVRRIYIDSDRAMEQVPDELFRIVLAFAGPTPGARQVAARARTLVEFVDYRLTGEPDNYHESRTIKEELAHTRAQLFLVHASRTVSKQWRDLITYGSTRQLTLKADSCVDLPPDFATRFGGCEAFTIDGDGDDYTSVRTLPASLQTTTTLRVLEVWNGWWLAGPYRHYQTGEFRLQAGNDDVKLADAADEIARRDAILRPLSLAVPELRVLMHANDGGKTPKGASMRCWHARCGYDWTDPVFF